MRKLFVSIICELMENDDKIYFLTGDLGYGVLDPIRDKFPNRFKNVGSSEQLMIGMAAGLHYQIIYLFATQLHHFVYIDHLN